MNVLIFLLPILLFAEVGYIEPWGKDAAIQAYPEPPSPKPKLSPLATLAEKTILFHHKVLTHIDGPRSHFRPTSSAYMLQAIRKYGFFKGFIMGCDRLLRENSDPWVYRTRSFNGTVYKWDPP